MFYKTVEGIKNIISGLAKRWQKLKEQEAVFGLHTPPEILIEIEEIEKKIKELNAQLEKAEKQHEQFVHSATNSSTNISDSLQKIESRVEELNVQLEKAEERQRLIIQNAITNSLASSPTSNLLNGTVSIKVSGANHKIRIEIGASANLNDISISGLNNNQTVYIPNVKNLFLKISGANNRLYIPKNLLERISVKKSGSNNEIIAI